jgi:monofunctional biosynthetic peptidoglycan transglycosylase
MAKKSRARAKPKENPIKTVRRSVLRWFLRGVSALFLLAVVLVLLWKFLNPPTTLYMWQESRRLGGVEQDWVAMENIAPVMARAVVAAEDANFCNHWGFDVRAIRKAIEEGGNRGASTLSQQVVKNVYLWHGRNYTRKAMEALMTPLLEALWTKRRIVEVYLNVAEFDEGVFGVEAAARHYFGVSAADLSGQQAGRLAALLPDPKARSASSPSQFVQTRGRQILDGAQTIGRDGRAACFES